MNPSIYLNYAATSAKKPEQTIHAMTNYLMQNNHGNMQRGIDPYAEERILFETRYRLAQLFESDHPENVIFSYNVTTALNQLIHGFLQTGDHVLTTTMEHNAVLRPLYDLEQQNMISVTHTPCTPAGEFDPESIHQYIQSNTRLLIMTHASNVNGIQMPIYQAAKIAKQYGCLVIIDVAQTAGTLPISMKNQYIDAIAFTGHKGLLGPTGTGGFILQPSAIEKIRPWLTGGTGSHSESLKQPEQLPDKFEAGTINTLGILGLGESIDFLLNQGISTIHQHEQALTQQFLTGISDLPLEIYTAPTQCFGAPIVSINIRNIDPAFICQILWERYQIITRAGLHCAPLAHQTLGTDRTGTVRFSFGFFTESWEIDCAIHALTELSMQAKNKTLF